MRPLAERLLKAIRKQELINAGDRVGVAVSAGADSVALLSLLVGLRAELGIVLSVVHVNHKLRGEESEADEQFVTGLANKLGLELHRRIAPLAKTNSGIEAAARKLRYDFFNQLAATARVSKIATAHTLDDQAETVLLRMLRGAGIRGLSGIRPRISLETGAGELVRPLLRFRRIEIESYLREYGQTWREDSSNQNTAFLRNRVRHRLVPLLNQDFGTEAVENLADLAEIARAEEEHWQAVHPEIQRGAESRSLAVASLLALPLAAQRRLIREWLHENVGSASVTFRLTEEVRDLALAEAGKKLELHDGLLLRRTQRELRLEAAPGVAGASDYAYRLTIPGSVAIAELGITVNAVLTERDRLKDGDAILDPARLPAELLLRNWQPGDRFCPAHTKTEKKVKDLLNAHHIVGRLKQLWPVAVAEGQGLVWVRGLATPLAFQPGVDAGFVLLISVV